jgi:hypothetical protein
MFRRLNDFGYSRSLVEAIGFYLAYGCVGLIAIVALAYVATLVKSDFGFQEGLWLGTIAASIISLALSFLILRAKGLLGHVGYLTVAVLSCVGALAAGLFLSLIFVAFLTTRQPAGEGVEQVATA